MPAAWDFGVDTSARARHQRQPANLLRKWIDKRAPRSSRVASLVPVTITPVTDEVQPAVAAAAPRHRSAGGVIEIDIDGVRVRLRGEVDAQRLGVVLKALARRP